jgi:hypothetical protein
MYIMDMNQDKQLKLMAVFWDYPRFRDEIFLKHYLEEKKGQSAYYWVMNRFLQYGRVVDTFHFFKIQEIADNLGTLQLPEFALKKWTRMVEVYG